MNIFFLNYQINRFQITVWELIPVTWTTIKMFFPVVYGAEAEIDMEAPGLIGDNDPYSILTSRAEL